MIPFLKPILPSVERYQKHINLMHEQGWFTNNGPFVQQFEKDLQEYLQTNREIVAVSNGTTALIAALKGLGIKGAVLVPSFTFVATISAVEWCGLPYEYVDIKPDTWCICPVELEKKLVTGKYEAIMPVHTLGNPCAITEITELAKKYNVKVIYDAASAIGASYSGRRIGTFGDAEVFSLHATKCLPIGEGGFVAVKNYEVAQHIRQFINFGFNEERSATILGLNGKLPEVAAAIGIEALQDLKQHIRNREQYVRLYKKMLSGVVEFQAVEPGAKHGMQIFSVLVDDALRVEQEMQKRGIQVRRYYSPAVHTQPAHQHEVVLLNTTDVVNRVLSLPLYSIMDEYLIEHIVSQLREVLSA